MIKVSCMGSSLFAFYQLFWLVFDSLDTMSGGNYTVRENDVNGEL